MPIDNAKVYTKMAHMKVGQVLSENASLMKILESYSIVRLDDDEFNERLSWCMEHCSGKFRDIRESDCRAWYFQHEQDASMFALKWS